MLETLDYTIRIGSTPTILYFDLYLCSAYAAHDVYFYKLSVFVSLVLSSWRHDAKPLADFADSKNAMAERFYRKHFAFLIHFRTLNLT